MAETKTKPTGASVDEYLASRASPEQLTDCSAIMAICKRVTRQQPRMWGPSIVGYGTYTYKYASGHTGQSCLAAFAVRGRELVVYLLDEDPSQVELLAKLGKHKKSKACLSFKRLADLDVKVLERLISNCVAEVKRRYPNTGALLRPSLCALLLAIAPALPAQGLITGRALLPNSTQPLACADAALRRTNGTVVATTFTREDGTFEFASPAAGRYVVAFNTLGMAEAVAPLDSLHPTSDLDRTFAVPLNAVDSLVERVDAGRSDKRYAQLARNSGMPRYPVAERDNGREGGIVAAVVVKADGRVDTSLSSILYASAEPFEASVREAFWQMLFEPAQFAGQARCSLLVLPYIYALAANGATRSRSYILGDVAVLPPSVVTPLPAEQRGLCPPLPVETDGTPSVYLTCQVDREAREIRSSAVLNWEPAPGEVQPNSCFRVEIRLVVDTLGVPERGTVSLISTNNGGFGAAFVALVPDLRFSPARLNGRPVRQVVTFKESIGVTTSIQSGIGVGSSTPSRRTRC